MKTTRREFLGRSAAAGVMISMPFVRTERSVFGKDANSKPTIAAIGVGGSHGRYSQGGGVARRAAKFGKMIAVCDVDQVHNEEFNKSFGGSLKMYGDYRKMFDEIKPDVVTIGTPDHWHVAIAIAALHAGADVYCEKPLTLTLEEGFKIRKVVKETGQVFQVGTQQRSENDSRFLKAIAIVQSGRLGKNVNAYVAVGGAPGDGPFATTPVPEGLDWDMWLGPAPKKGYSEQRRRMFRWWFEYSGGKMTDWGAHHIDIAQWALGFDRSGPVKVNGKGKFGTVVPAGFDWLPFLNGHTNLPDGYNTAVTFNIDLTFPNGALMSVNDNYKREKDGIEFGNGILFEGEKGRIFVNRGKLEGKPVDELTEADKKDLEERIVKLYKGKKPGNHMANFFECIEDRTQPVSDVDSHVRTMTSCHLCNISLMLGREVKWDPQKEEFVDDKEAAGFVSRARRKGFPLGA